MFSFGDRGRKWWGIHVATVSTYLKNSVYSVCAPAIWNLKHPPFLSHRNVAWRVLADRSILTEGVLKPKSHPSEVRSFFFFFFSFYYLLDLGKSSTCWAAFVASFKVIWPACTECQIIVWYMPYPASMSSVNFWQELCLQIDHERITFGWCLLHPNAEFLRSQSVFCKWNVNVQCQWADVNEKQRAEAGSSNWQEWQSRSR